jgi:tetraacyldisaccharide 4'-kinase
MRLDRHRGAVVVAVSGIRSPESFHASLDEAGVRLAASVTRPDHHRFRPTDWREAAEAASRAGADAVVTTEKDLARIEDREALRSLGRPVWALRVDVEFEGGERALWDQILPSIRLRGEAEGPARPSERRAPGGRAK